MNLSDPVERWLALGRSRNLRGHDLGLADQLLDCHRNVFRQVDLLESLNIRGTRIDHDKFRFSHLFLLLWCLLDLRNLSDVAHLHKHLTPTGPVQSKVLARLMSAAMTIEAYLSLRGRMHGDREEIIPAPNATKLIPTRAPLIGHSFHPPASLFLFLTDRRISLPYFRHARTWLGLMILALPLHESTLLPPESKNIRLAAQCSSS